MRARPLLAGGRHLLAGGFDGFAARQAYLAGFDAASAYVVHRTGRRPKTHAGTRSELLRPSREHGDPSQASGLFLARGYDNEVEADYGQGVPATREDAERALAEAEQFVNEVERPLPPGDQSA